MIPGATMYEQDTRKVCSMLDARNIMHLHVAPYSGATESTEHLQIRAVSFLGLDTAKVGDPWYCHITNRYWRVFHINSARTHMILVVLKSGCFSSV